MRSALSRIANWKLTATAAIVLVVAGCGQKMTLPEGFAEAYGTLTLDGEPVPNAAIEFITVNGRSYGRTDENGYYVMEKSSSLTGTPIGETRVAVTTTATFRDEDVDPESAGLTWNAELETWDKPEIIPAKYVGEATEYVIDVVEGGAPYDIALTSDPEEG